ncbi:MAG TPA: tRNA uridine-5-carboxymethylaminomethyl(34) synthesis enzyme MnmG [Treponemataceae bacterium]|nr:tRNA uridine-5-carboxymethylaminomethyl(34) synthesis enzyme MnmG [Treponemataceae bacterium]HPS43235.1 tRNA uridine-5-carboxymethylaminomethyl(34) synthesis enzyme MnmG [Treponemataceae bacterium]
MGFRYTDYDVIVIGGGHAGIEAALAAARMGESTLLITQTLDTIGKLSCNPSIGGISKGNIVREIDALGGEMGRLADATMIQYRLLNRSRGPAVQAPRVQADKWRYHQLAKHTLELEKGLHLYQDTIVDFAVSGADSSGACASGDIRGVITSRGREITAKAVVLTTGTFMEGKIFIGEFEAREGRLGEQAAIGLGTSLRRLGFSVGRLKTGTPPRILRGSVDFSGLERQDGDPEPIPFSYAYDSVDRPAVPCWLTYTNEETHRIIRDNIHRSPLYSGKIKGIGPRYCPSIEDKVVRFAARERHQLFLEPEGLDTEELYINGLSSSLPEEVQDSFMRTIPGLEAAVVTRPSYAVEYDYVEPTQLTQALETKRLRGLFTAGQINGTSGYEEAGGQGLIAGINAALRARSVRSGNRFEPFTLGRSDAYIGVLIDDLVTLGTKEPYRMFTARAEYRLRLRHDTADERLTERAAAVGLERAGALDRLRRKLDLREAITESWQARKVTTADAESHPSLAKHIGKSCADALRDPLVPLEDIISLDDSFRAFPQEIRTSAELEIRYSHYIDAQDKRVDRLKRMDGTRIPEDFDFEAISGLSMESRIKLKAVKPATLGQASRISGLRPSDVMLLMIHLR